MSLNINNKYNNVVKKRRLLLERAAKEIMRYTAGNSFQTLGSQLERSKLISNPKCVDDILKNVFSSISEPYPIKKIIDEISNLPGEYDVYKEIFIIYTKQYLNEKFENKQFGSKMLKSGNLSRTDAGSQSTNQSLFDIKEYFGYSNLGSGNSQDTTKIFNNPGGESKRFSNPNFAIIKVKDHNISFIKSKEAEYVPFIATVIPAIEMSRCVPHLNVSIIDDDRNVNNILSLSKFLVGRKSFPKDGFARGMSTVDFVEKQDAVLSTASDFLSLRANQNVNKNISGMELFQSPQSMINSDINKYQSGAYRVLNPFLPFMSIESFSVTDELKQLEWMTVTSGNLSLKLYDRSRIPDIAKIIGRDYLAGVFLIIEFGWSHPDGSIISNNPFGQFLDSLKRRELFVISDSNITINDDGTCSIKLSITSLGHDTIKKNGMTQKFITIEKYNEYILSLQKLVKEKSAEKNNTTLWTTIKTKIEDSIYLNHFDSNDLIFLEALESMPDGGFFKRYESIVEMSAEASEQTLKEAVIKFTNDAQSILSYTPKQKEDEKEKDEIVAEFDRPKYDISILTLDKDEETILNIYNSLINSNAPDSFVIDEFVKFKFTQEDINTFLINNGWTKERLSNAYIAVGFVDSSVTAEYKEEELKKTYSTTAGVINDLIKFISFGDGEFLSAINTGASGTTTESIKKTSNELGEDRNNDTSTIIARLREVLPTTENVSKFWSVKDDYRLIIEEDGEKSDLTNDYLQQSVSFHSYITLSRLIGYIYGLPDSLERTHDETQMFFHPANQQAGAFNNISLGDVFISTERYLNAVANLVQSRRSANLKIEDHFNIIRTILLSPDTEAGYGISFYKSTLDEGESDKEKIKADSAAADKFNENMNKKLMKIYSKSPGNDLKTLAFKRINLKVKVESIPYMENDIIKKIKRIHVFDSNSESFYNEKKLLDSINNTSINSVLNTVSFPFFDNNLNNSKKVKKFTSKINADTDNKKLVSKIKESSSILTDKITDKITTNIETIIKASVPTIEMGAENGIVQTISLSNNNGGLANKLNMMDYVTSLGNPQNDDKQRKRIRPLLVPSTVNVSMFGMPVISIGQAFYVTAKTNTTLDNIYRVSGISHSIGEGSFLTTLTLEATMDAVYDPENISENVAKLQGWTNLNNSLAEMELIPKN